MLLGAGAFLLVVLFVLLQAVQSSSSSTAAPSRDQPASASEHVASATPAAQPSAPAGPGKRTSFLPPVVARLAPGGGRGESAPSIPTDPNPAPATRANTKNLHYGNPQLVAQTAAIEPLVVKCIEADVAAGHSPSGRAVLTYIVAQRGAKVAVEETGVDEDKTTLQGEQLLECLQGTSRSMKFEGLPREAEALVVTRGVTVEHGKLTENSHVNFSYLR